LIEFTILTSLSRFPFLIRILDSWYFATVYCYTVLTPFEMELHSRVLAEVETRDSDPGVPGPSSLVIEGSGRPVPDTGPPLCSTSEEAGASTSHTGTAGLMWVTLRTPTAGSSQMFGTIGAVDNPDVYAECDVALEAGPEARPTQPPHPQRIADLPTGDPVDLELYGSPDTVNIGDILSVDVTPLSSISTSGMDATACPDMSVAKSVSVDRDTLISVDFDDHTREIQDIVAMSEFTDTVGAHPL